MNRDGIRCRDDRGAEDTHSADAAPMGGVEGLAKVEGNLSLMFLHCLGELGAPNPRLVACASALAAKTFFYWGDSGGKNLFCARRRPRAPRRAGVAPARAACAALVHEPRTRDEAQEARAHLTVDAAQEVSEQVARLPWRVEAALAAGRRRAVGKSTARDAHA
eukprot:scaffold124294_cov60-Phaeocystis_antarctica.AAC.4